MILDRRMSGFFPDSVSKVDRQRKNEKVAEKSGKFDDKHLTKPSTIAGRKRRREPALPRSTDPLVVGRVIGDVLEPFVPSVEMSVKYDVRQVSNGCELKPSATATMPRVQVGGRTSTDSLYTLVMTDPDAPSPSEPSLREMIHWLVTDIRGGSDASQGREVFPYAGPKPPIGIHRYIFVLFKQEQSLLLSPPGEYHFSVRAFAQRHGLGLPVAAVYYNAQKETGARRR